MHKQSFYFYFILFFFLAGGKLISQNPAGSVPLQSLVRVADINTGEEVSVILHDGSIARVKVLGVEEIRESVTKTLMGAIVRVIINGEQCEISSGSYRLPVMAGGVQVDIPVIAAYMKDSHIDWWYLKKDVRMRFWPAGSPWIEPGTFVYPVRQRWLASGTSYSNEPVSRRATGKVYYHSGMDIGGAEGLSEVVSATGGVVKNLGMQQAQGEPHPAARPRADVIYIEDERGWLYRYSHLKVLDPSLKAGGMVMKGQRLGYIGKEGSSGGWTHLHFSVESLQPSGEWGVQDSYAFLWQAYLEEYDPKVLAVARPHHKVLPGEKVILDAARSWAKNGIHSYEWLLMDGTRVKGPRAYRVYDKPGIYSEIIKVTDKSGNVDYDFSGVEVYSGSAPDGTATIVDVHAAYYPTFGIRPGDPVIFLSRAFRTKPGGVDNYDFGDGSPVIPVPSNIDAEQHAANGYGMVTHHFQKPGNYIVKIERKDEETGYTAVQHLHVVVEH
jgi:murein DD-endopeptidase MepM/ murein hydrolase activator NlpD